YRDRQDCRISCAGGVLAWSLGASRGDEAGGEWWDRRLRIAVARDRDVTSDGACLPDFTRGAARAAHCCETRRYVGRSAHDRRCVREALRGSDAIVVEGAGG